MHLPPGEPEATGWRTVTVVDAVRRLRAAVPGSVVVHTDDVAWNHACFD